MTRRPEPRVLAAILLLASGCFAHQYRNNPRVAIVDGDPIVQMKPPGELPSVDQATLVPAEKHSDPPDEVDSVLGIVIGQEARAYPIGLLDKFEVVNDSVADLPLLVARCALAGTAAVYDRRVEGRALTFENAGALWRDTLVFRDRETETYWTAATGRALSGPLAGRQLRAIPAVVTREHRWRSLHPGSLYLDLDRSTRVPLAMRLYEASTAQGVSGAKTADRRYGGKSEVFVVAAQDRQAFAFRAAELREAKRINVSLDGRAVAIEWDPELETGRAFLAAPGRSELPVTSMYWFAVGRHYERVTTFRELSHPGGRRDSTR